MKKVPDIVLARVDLHAAESRERLARRNAELEGRQISAVLSKRLRAMRDQARAEAEAWEGIANHIRITSTEGANEAPEPDRVAVRYCGICKHEPHGAGDCRALGNDGGISNCGCSGRAPALDQCPVTACGPSYCPGGVRCRGGNRGAEPDRVVGWLAQSTGLGLDLYCLDHEPPDSVRVPVTSETLTEGGTCKKCGRDVLA